MELLSSLWNWYVESFTIDNIARQGFAVFITIIVALAIASQLHKLFTGTKKVLMKQQKDSDVELAFRQRGHVPTGCKIYVFDINLGSVTNVYDDRYRSTNEIDPEKFVQIASFSEQHAIKKFNRIYRGGTNG